MKKFLPFFLIVLSIFLLSACTEEVETESDTTTEVKNVEAPPAVPSVNN